MLVVDDSSPDGTGRAVGALQREHERLHLIERPRRAGLGTAYLDGFSWALERSYWAIVEMDGDLSHDPADVSRLLDALEVASLAIGSRYVDGGAVLNWGVLRRSLSRAGNLYARLWLGFGVRDSTSGFRAYRADDLRALNLDSVGSEGYAFQIEMVRRMQLTGAVIDEVPITFTERTAGKSKMSRRIVFEALWRVPLWGIRDRRAARRC
jgi:dolichol-phosphate mannosyltransferase